MFSFQARRDKILENAAMQNALYCDPRYIFLLTIEERSLVRRRLIALYNRLKSEYSNSYIPIFPQNEHQILMPNVLNIYFSDKARDRTCRK
jgi:hypothetical protein